MIRIDGERTPLIITIKEIRESPRERIYA